MNTTSQVGQLSRDRVKSLLAFALLPEARLAADGVPGEVCQAMPDHDSLAPVLRGEGWGEGHDMALLLADLQTPAFTPGPLSVVRLTHLDPAEVSALGDRSFLQVLASSAASVTTLRALAEYGELLQEGPFPQSAQLAGVTIWALALASLLARGAAHLSAEEIHSTRSILDQLANTASFPQAIRDQAHSCVVELDRDRQPG